MQIVGVQQADIGAAARPPAPAPGRSGAPGWRVAVAAQIAQPQPARRADRSASAAPGARRRRRAPAPGGDTPADRAPAPRSRRCRSCTAGSVGWRSETISQREAAALERQDLLRDEGLGQPRVALDDDRDPGAGGRHRGASQARLRRAPQARRGARPGEPGRRPLGDALEPARADRDRPRPPAAASRAAPRRRSAMAAGARMPSSASSWTSPSWAARSARSSCSWRGSVRGTRSAGLPNERISQKVL